MEKYYIMVCEDNEKYFKKYDMYPTIGYYTGEQIKE